MKVGIVTFHRAHNYGAVLQAYALQSYLKFLGCEVFFIDHKNESMLSCYKIWDVHRFISKHPTKMLNKIQNEVRLIKHRINRYNKFENFINSFFCLKNASSSNVRLLDLIIVGSDQVWNTHLTNGFDDYYWGNLNIREDARIISYAASIEEYWNETYNTKAKNLLNKFNAISVREQKTAEYLRIFLDKDINVTIDPTLLVDSSVWEKFAQKPSLADNYLLFYQVRNSPEC
jgi:polysaccharide pyruvyl transferase WcaK-like protein